MASRASPQLRVCQWWQPQEVWLPTLRKYRRKKVVAREVTANLLRLQTGKLIKSERENICK